MSSGRRESVMIFCVSPISRLYLDPIDHYEPDIVHVFIGTRKDAISSIEREAYGLCKGRIACGDIVEHRIDISDYNQVLGEIIEIMNDLHQRYGKDLDVFINISSGTPEFSAAGMFASMIPESATAFKVDVESTLSSEELKQITDSLNDSVCISEPERVSGLKNERPDDEMITFLSVIRDLLDKTKYPKYRNIIDGLKGADAWSYDPDKKSGYGRTTLEEKEERYLKRHYIAIAMENGWLERPSPNTMRLTESGKAYISVYGQVPERKCAKMECNRLKMEAEPCMDLRSDSYYSLTDYGGFDDEVDFGRSNTVTFTNKGKRYVFTIGMDQHR